ncbi:MAG: carbohydrate ABC transporter permease, partial [Gemmatirosa sp.]|nr:carbohydrate ABC transporter permease [Gemmatirosa sp.]
MSRVTRALVLGALVGGGIVTLAPMAWMLAASFMQTGEASTYPPHLLPRAPTLEHYRALFTRLDLGRYALNSALVAGVVTAASLLINAAAGYGFAKLRFRGRDRTFRWLATGLVVPTQVAMLPLFLLLKSLHL